MVLKLSSFMYLETLDWTKDSLLCNVDISYLVIEETFTSSWIGYFLIVLVWVGLMAGFTDLIREVSTVGTIVLVVLRVLMVVALKLLLTLCFVCGWLVWDLSRSWCFDWEAVWLVKNVAVLCLQWDAYNFDLSRAVVLFLLVWLLYFYLRVYIWTFLNMVFL